MVGKKCKLCYFTRDQDGKPSQAFRSRFLQELIRREILAPSLVVSYSRSDEDMIEPSTPSTGRWPFTSKPWMLGSTDLSSAGPRTSCSESTTAPSSIQM